MVRGTCASCLALYLAICGVARAQLPAVAPAASAAALPAAGALAPAAAAAPAAATPTLWNFLGVPQIGKGITKLAQRLRFAIHRRLPFGQPLVPPMTPAEQAASPAAGAAAKAAEEEKNAEVNVAALEFLTRFGCSDCYPDTENAIFSGLESCITKVRLAAAKAARQLAGCCCPRCQSNACCSKRIREKLEDLGYGRDDFGCFKETDASVRRHARLAFHACNCLSNQPIEPATELIPEGPSELPPPVSAHPPKNQLPEQPQDKVDTAAAAAPPQTPAANAPPAASEKQAATLDKADWPVARVNFEPIYVSDLTGKISPSGSPAMSPHDWRSLPVAVARERLQHVIDRKLVCQEARRHNPIERASFQSSGADAAAGGHVDEAALAESFLREQVKVPTAISPDELQSYYQRYPERWIAPAEVRWEELTVLASRFSTAEHAATVARYLRDQSLRQSAPPGRAPLPTLPTTVVPRFQPADIQVRQVTWTPVPELERNNIYTHVHNLPQGGTSEVVDVPDGYRIYRVLGRRRARRLPLAQVADEIGQEISDLRWQQAKGAYIHQLRAAATVWSVFGDEGVTPSTKVMPLPAVMEQDAVAGPFKESVSRRE